MSFLLHAYLLKHSSLSARRNYFCVLPYLGIMSKRLERLWLLRSTSRIGFVILTPSMLYDNLKQFVAFEISSEVVKY